MTKAQMRAQSQHDSALIEMGEARLMYNTWLVEGENQKAWFKKAYQSLVQAHGADYAERVRGYMGLIKREHLEAREQADKMAEELGLYSQPKD